MGEIENVHGVRLFVLLILQTNMVSASSIYLECNVRRIFAET